MQRAPVTVEEQLLQKAIKEECPWENLPKRIQATLSSKEEWHRRLEWLPCVFMQISSSLLRWCLVIVEA